MASQAEARQGVARYGMAGIKRAHWKQVVYQFPCEVCGAGPYMPCITTSGAEKSEVHVHRSRLASEYHWELFEEGEQEEPP